MPKLSTFAMSMFRPRSLCVLALALFFFVNGSTIEAFAPSPNQWAFGAKGTIARTPNQELVPSFRNEKTLLLAHPLLQLAAQASSIAPNKLLLMKDMSRPLSSVLTADPDVEAQFLVDVSHIFLDFTAFFKFDGQFLNYAQLFGRISFILIDFLPGHAFHAEEMAIQIFFLGINIQKIWKDSEPLSPSSSTDITADEIELQQQKQTRPLLAEEPIDMRSDDKSFGETEEEKEKMMINEWEEVEFEMDK